MPKQIGIVVHHDDVESHRHGDITLLTFSPGQSLAAMQHVVGGLVECVSLYDSWVYGQQPSSDFIADAWCNEEGLLHRLPPNGRAREIFELHAGWAPFQIPVGNVIIAGMDPESGDTSGVDVHTLDRLFSRYSFHESLRTLFIETEQRLAKEAA